MTHTQLLRDAIPRAEELHRGLRELSSQLGSAAGAAAMDAEAAASELLRTLRFSLKEYEKWEALDDDEPQPLSSGWIEPFDLVLPPPPPPWDGPWRRVPSSGCYEASFGWVHMKPGCRCPR